MIDVSNEHIRPSGDIEHRGKLQYTNKIHVGYKFDTFSYYCTSASQLRDYSKFSMLSYREDESCIGHVRRSLGIGVLDLLKATHKMIPQGLPLLWVQRGQHLGSDLVIFLILALHFSTHPLHDRHFIPK